MSDVLSAALAYIERGWPVLPCHLGLIHKGKTLCTCKRECASPGKHPILENGVHGASLDKDVVTSWFTDWPLATVAIATGAKSKILVIDVDPRNGGFETYETLNLPPTLTVATGGGGIHLYYSFDGVSGYKLPKTLGPGVDVKGEGGYVLAPPSRHCSGDLYRWSSETPMASSDWMVQRGYIKENDKSTPAIAPTVTANHDHKIEMSCAAVQLSAVGERNSVLNREAYTLGGLGDSIDVDAVKDRLRQAASISGLGDEEIESTLERAFEQGRSNPRYDAEVEVVPGQPTLRSGRELPVSQDLLETLETTYKSRFVYSKEDQAFYRYEPRKGVWLTVPDAEIANVLIGWDGLPTSKDGKHFLSVRNSLITNVLALMKIQRNEIGWFEGGDVLGFKNGAWKDGALVPHSPTHRIKYRVEYPYDRNATCPRFQAFLREILPDGGSRRAIQEFVGNVLTRRAHLYEKGIVMAGAGKNGKSQLLNIIEGLIPREAIVSVPPHEFKRGFSVIKLNGAWLNRVSELERNEMRETETFKAVISGDLLQGEKKYQDPIEFRPRLGCIFAANSLPNVTDASVGMWRRMMVIPFDFTVPEEDTIIDIGNKILAEEASGIVNWAIKGAIRCDTQKGYTESARMVRRKEEWKTDSNHVAQWFDECMVLTAKGREMGSDIYNSYRGWCAAYGQRAISMSIVRKHLKALGIDGVRRSVGIVYDGVAIQS